MLVELSLFIFGSGAGVIAWRFYNDNMRLRRVLRDEQRDNDLLRQDLDLADLKLQTGRGTPGPTPMPPPKDPNTTLEAVQALSVQMEAMKQSFKKMGMTANEATIKMLDAMTPLIEAEIKARDFYVIQEEP